MTADKGATSGDVDPGTGDGAAGESKPTETKKARKASQARPRPLRAGGHINRHDGRGWVPEKK